MGITLDVQGSLVRVYDEQGALVPTIIEQARRLVEHDRLLALRQAEHDRLLALRQAEHDREIARLQAELRALKGVDTTGDVGGSNEQG